MDQMEALETRTQIRDYEVRTWELNFILLEIILLGGAAVGAFWSIGPELLGANLPWEDAALKGVGFFILGLALYPVLSIEARKTRGREVRFGRWLLGALVGSAVGSAIYLVLP